MYKCESFKNEIFVKGQKAFKNLKFNLAETTEVDRLVTFSSKLHDSRSGDLVEEKKIKKILKKNKAKKDRRIPTVENLQI